MRQTQGQRHSDCRRNSVFQDRERLEAKAERQKKSYLQVKSEKTQILTLHDNLNCCTFEKKTDLILTHKNWHLHLFIYGRRFYSYKKLKSYSRDVPVIHRFGYNISISKQTENIKNVICYVAHNIVHWHRYYVL